MILPTGQRVALAKPQGGLGPDRLTLTFNDTQAAGVYQLVSEDGVQATKFALAPDLRESENLDALSEEQLDELLGFAPVHRVADGAWTLFSSEARGDNVWTVWVLLGLFFLTFGESAWAWVCGRAW